MRSSSRLSGRFRVLFAVVLTALLAACELRAEVNVIVSDDGSGVVELAVGIDEASAASRPDLLGDIDVDRLVDDGWVVTGPVPENGFAWVRAEHSFDDPSQVEALVDAVAGDSGPFQNFTITRGSSFASESMTFEGIVDFTGIVDSELDDVVSSDEVLGEGAPADETVAELGDRFGAAVDDIVEIKVAVRLPGDVESNAATRASNGAVWRPSVTADGPLTLTATGTTVRTGRMALVVVGVVAAVVAVLAGSIRLAVWRRKK